MKKAIILLSFLLPVIVKAQKVDTTKKYTIKLTETEYQALTVVMKEAAQYEADQQRDKNIQNNLYFLKQNTDTIPADKPKK